EHGIDGYEHIKARYNARPNGADLLFLCRSCYGGVGRFRLSDGDNLTPPGIHQPTSPEAFFRTNEKRKTRIKGTSFQTMDYVAAMESAKRGDLIYCDPPYSHSQSILYGSQRFSLMRLLEIIERCKSRDVYVALSIDGTKKSGSQRCDLP